MATNLAPQNGMPTVGVSAAIQSNNTSDAVSASPSAAPGQPVLKDTFVGGGASASVEKAMPSHGADKGRSTLANLAGMVGSMGLAVAADAFGPEGPVLGLVAMAVGGAAGDIFGHAVIERGNYSLGQAKMDGLMGGAMAGGMKAGGALASRLGAPLKAGVVKRLLIPKAGMLAGMAGGMEAAMHLIPMGNMSGAGTMPAGTMRPMEPPSHGATAPPSTPPRTGSTTPSGGSAGSAGGMPGMNM
jgi:hypothetical protein